MVFTRKSLVAGVRLLVGESGAAVVVGAFSDIRCASLGRWTSGGAQSSSTFGLRLGERNFGDDIGLKSGAGGKFDGGAVAPGGVLDGGGSTDRPLPGNPSGTLAEGGAIVGGPVNGGALSPVVDGVAPDGDFDGSSIIGGAVWSGCGSTTRFAGGETVVRELPPGVVLGVVELNVGERSITGGDVEKIDERGSVVITSCENGTS
jgi:hypothetical protein